MHSRERQLVFFTNEGLRFEETIVLRQCGSETLKFVKLNELISVKLALSLKDYKIDISGASISLALRRSDERVYQILDVSSFFNHGSKTKEICKLFRYQEDKF